MLYCGEKKSDFLTFGGDNSKITVQQVLIGSI